MYKNRSFFLLFSFSNILLLILLLFVGFACQSDKSLKIIAENVLNSQPVLEHSEEQSEEFYAALKKIPSQSYVSFADYLVKIQLELAKSKDPDIKNISKLWSVDVEGNIIFTENVMWTRALLLARYARLSQKNDSFALLEKLVSRKTTNARDVKIPGRGPEFDDLEADLKQICLQNNLLFSEVDHVAYEISTGKSANIDKSVAVIAHSDVVPADPKKWNTPPFKMSLKDGKYFGRGILDDKAAIAAVISAMSVLKKSNLKLKAEPLLVIGTSEESHWHGIDVYQKVRKLPENVFVTDADFPVGIGEKGVMTLRIKNIPVKFKASQKTLMDFEVIEFDGGVVSNQVPAEAHLLLKGSKRGIKELYQNIVASIGADYAKEVYRVEIINKNQLKISIKGKAAHAATPDKGVNAVAKLMKLIAHTKALEKTSKKNQCLRLALLFDTLLDSSNAAEKLGFPRGSGKFSKPTVNIGTFRQLQQNQCEVALNFRWPPPEKSAELKAIASKLMTEKAAELGFQVEISGGGLEPFYIDPTSPLVQRLLKSYELVFGEKAEPITVSGTTYAKAVPGSVTFGPASIDDGGGRIHAANEYITEEEFLDLIETYTLAIAQFSL